MANPNFAEISEALHFFELPEPIIYDSLSKDIPVGTEPTSFVYNFYEADESVDDTGGAAKAIRDPDPQAKPRYVKFSFGMPAGVPMRGGSTLIALKPHLLYNPPGPEPPNAAASGPPPYDEVDEDGEPVLEATTVNGRFKILPRMINNEISLQSKPSFAKIDLQDLNADTKLYNLVKTTAQKRILQENKRVQQDVNAAKENFLSRAFQSQTDLVKVLKRQVGASEDFIANSLNNIQEINETYIDEDERKEIFEDNFKAVKRARFTPRLSMKFISSLLSSATTDPIGTYSEELLPMSALAKDVQAKAIKDYMPQPVGESPSTNLLPGSLLAWHPEGTSRKYTWQLNSMSFWFSGYIIYKNEILDDGSIILKDTITLSANARAQSQLQEYIDYNVAYGRNYSYQVDALYAVQFPIEFPAQNGGFHGGNGTGTPPWRQVDSIDEQFFVTSRRSRASFVKTTEKVNPRPPEAMRIAWHQQDKGALITWNMPLNIQRDIKRFQVLRRPTINDPFELLVELDFDQSVVKYDTPENVTRALRIKSKAPIFHFIDKNIDKDREYIYTLRSVDAHGLISQYSEQLAAKYNKFTNRIDSRFISTRCSRTIP